MRSAAIAILLTLAYATLSGQVVDSLNQETSPHGGINQLAIKYYGIDFSKEQRALLENVEVEFVYSVDERGSAILEEVNGISDAAIIDSLQRRTDDIENFNPRIVNGKAEPSIYFMKLSFPSYKLTQSTYGLLQGSAYNEAELEDFEYIKESGGRFDVVIGGMANQFIGSPATHLSLGGGMKSDINFTTKNRIIFGLTTSFAGNGLKMDFPISSTREQSSPVTGFIGIAVGKWFDQFSITGDLSLAYLNLTEKLGDNDPDWVQLRGWSPGLTFNYPIRLGKENPMYYYGAPTLFSHNVNLSVGLRYLMFDLKEASGLMLELGLAYRMAVKGIKEYKLRDEYLKQ